MTKKKDPKQDNSIAQIFDQKPTPWISMNKAVWVIGITSIAMAVLTAMQAVPVLGWLEGSLWGLLYGAMIWLIFFGMLWFNKKVKRS